ncbi:MAG: DNA mismatch repair protein MutS [Rikenellaceae bacterium]|nr:DNA mismatch repair protein MutS [Rikenellaceae bacterium]
MARGKKIDEEQEKKSGKTKLMEQYDEVKAQNPDAIVLFRMGDFYETFGADAIEASAILGITLTRRANGGAATVELAGFPHHAIDTYLPRLVRAGKRVAICEQLEDPKLTKNVVRRGVVEVITPGVVLENNILEQKENHYLASVYFGRTNTGVAFLDLTTGEFSVAEGDDRYIEQLLSSFRPKEVVYQRGLKERFVAQFGSQYYIYCLEDWVFSHDVNYGKLTTHFGVSSLKGFGVEGMTSAISAAGAILYYLEFTHHNNVAHISSISRLDREEYVWIDKFTARNLELFASNGGGDNSFARTIDRTKTAMGGRLLRRWIAMPILDKHRIEERHDMVEAFVKDKATRAAVVEQLQQIGDIERIASRIASLRVLPRELLQLKNSLSAVSVLQAALESSDCDIFHVAGRNITSLNDVVKRIAETIYPDPASNQIQKGGIIADGVVAELDDLRRVALHGKEVLQKILEQESQITGIPSLKIGYNNVFGYYIEVRNTHKERVPEGWVRKQTLAAAERYVTEELKEYESKILGAEEKILALEQQIYQDLIAYLSGYIRDMQRNAQLVARIDCLCSMAELAVERKYVRPVLNDSTTIKLKAARHPVIEAMMKVGEQYVPNDLLLDSESQQIIMLTGPNMSGKSALLRQTALVVLMAQMGSFVPAAKAEIGLVDKIFTRVGASDNISQGESTFMVEMLESASILNNISERSLVLLDEIGRGTSTYDGISIAWAMVEYLHNHPTAHPRTLFATHYHELNDMEQVCNRVKNFHISVKEIDGTVVFLRKLERGGTEHSFGIHVARLAGMPTTIVERATAILGALEKAYGNSDMVPKGDLRKRGKKMSAQEVAEAAESVRTPDVQLSMFQLDDPVLVQIRDQIKGLDINSLTPLEALNKLNEIKKIAGI